MERNEIRIGRVSSVNRERGTCRVVYKDKDDAVTMELPLFYFTGEYKPPEIDEMVLVAHLSNGSAAGIVLGGFWNGDKQPEDPEADFYKDIAEDACIMHKDGTLTIKAKKIVIETEDSEIDMDDVAELVPGDEPDPDPEEEEET